MKSKAFTGVIAALAVCTSSGEALAAHFKTGLWKETGYMQDAASGKRTPCNGDMCITLAAPGVPARDFSHVCIATDILQNFAEETLAQRASLIGRRLKNCKATDPKISQTERETGLSCDGMTLTQILSTPDDSHLSYQTITKGTAVSGPDSGGMTVATNFEWLGSDCGDANAAIGPRPPQPKAQDLQH